MLSYFVLEMTQPIINQYAARQERVVTVWVTSRARKFVVSA